MFEFLDAKNATSIEADHLPNLREKRQWFADQITAVSEFAGIQCTPGQIHVDTSSGTNANQKTLEWLTTEYVKLDNLVSRLESKHGTE